MYKRTGYSSGFMLQLLLIYSEAKIMQEILKFLLQILLSLLNPIFLIPAIIIIIVLVKKNKDYKNSTYYQITKYSYFSMKYNVGRYGEYLTYKYLEQYEKSGARFLFNVYIPKENGETTEIDVLMISKKGLFVFESKNYSGWIFGSENQKNWYQTLTAGRGRSHKEHFFNPIMQNRSHIKHMKKLLGDHITMWSIIVFSERCTLKSVQVNSSDISVINRYNIAAVVADICSQNPNDLLTDKEIVEIYNKLFPYTQVDEIVKMQHVAAINNIAPQPVRQVNETPSQAIMETQTEKVIEQPKAIITETTETGERATVENIEPVITEKIEQKSLRCPKCNSSLALRTATRGSNAGKQFYGCSNYPKCKYIQNI